MFFINGFCYVCAACCTNESKYIKKQSQDLIIAADKGYETLLKNEISPDLVVGDFDSLNYIPNHPNTVLHPVKKDDTDTFLSVEEGFDRGYKSFVILGGIGGRRLDHTIANIQTLIHIAKGGGRGVLLGKNTVITAINNAKIFLPDKKRGFLSVFSFGAPAKEVEIKGFKYELSGAALDCATPLGVSNEFIGRKNAFISVKKGTLVIMWYENTRKILENPDYLTFLNL